MHHTATGNDYNCADSAAIVRSIQAYQVHSKGWDDIGYNFLVDKCGHIFEGRAGGVGRPVLGAHTLGFNTDASAIAVIGTYDLVRPSPTVERAIATVAAYKLGAYGNDPAGRVVLTSGGGNLYPQGTKANLYRISGHRDAGHHTVAIRAVHLSGRTSTVTTEVISDATASVFAVPRHATR